MRVLFLGDTHANGPFVWSVFQEAKRRNIEAIVQTGDFGWYPRMEWGAKFIEQVSDMAQTAAIPFYFVDGNHEDHQNLPHSADQVQELAPWLFYMPRGHSFQIGDTNILGLGGAVSVDKAYRTEFVDWFPEEVASFSDINRAMEWDDVDIVVAHDVPTGVELDLWYPVTEEIQQKCERHRQAMWMVRDSLKPSHWIAGHYHQRTTQQLEETEVVVLGHDGLGVEKAILQMEL